MALMALRMWRHRRHYSTSRRLDPRVTCDCCKRRLNSNKVEFTSLSIPCPDSKIDERDHTPYVCAPCLSFLFPRLMKAWDDVVEFRRLEVLTEAK